MPNPALEKGAFDTFSDPSTTTAGGIRVQYVRMTARGTVAKTLLLIGILLATATLAWVQHPLDHVAGLDGLVIIAALGGLGLAWYLCGHPEQAPTLAPIYAAVEGYVVGAISASVNVQYGGLPAQAVALTAATLATMLFLYRTKAIEATDRFRAIVVGLTGGVAGFYLIAIVLMVVGVPLPMLHEGGPIGIGFSVFVTGLAAFNLILDFDLIEQGVGKAPPYMEWYAAFGLIVTLVWLYLEILRLMRKLRRLGG